MLGNAITLSKTINVPKQNQRGVYGKRTGQKNFRWNGKNYTISNNNNNMTISAGIEMRNLSNYSSIVVGNTDVYKKLLSDGHRELADIVLTYTPRK